MAAINTITTTPYDPHELLSNPWRTIAPPVRYGNATLDTPIGEVARCVMVGTSGSLIVVDLQGNAATIPYLEAGQWCPIVFTQVNTGGSAGGDILWGS